MRRIEADTVVAGRIAVDHTAAAVGRIVADHIAAGRKAVAANRPAADTGRPAARRCPAAAAADKWEAAVERSSSPADHKMMARL